LTKWLTYILGPLIIISSFTSAGNAVNKSDDSYSVQAGAFLQHKNAEKMLSLLKGRGYASYIYQTYNSKRQRLFVVRIGDYKGMDQAVSAAAQFKKLEKMPVTVTKSDSVTPVNHRLTIQAKKPFEKVITSAELAQIDGRAGTIIPSDELAKIDGRTGAIMESGELAKIDGQTGTIMPSGELANIDGQTGSVMPSEELATVDGQTGSVMPSEELATVDGQTGTVIPSGKLATVDGQTGTVVPSKNLGSIDGQTGPALPKGDLSSSAEPSVPPQEGAGDSFGGMFEEQPSDGKQPIGSSAATELRRQIAELEDKINELREEADVRKILEITEEEKEEEEDQILSATGRDYTMAPKGSIGLDFSLGYSHNTPDTLSYLDAFPKVEHSTQHILTNSYSVSYAVRDNISLSVNIPFVYKYDSMGTANSKDVTDLGDFSLNVRVQPLKAGGKLPPFILNLGITYPLGRSPYKIDPSTEMSVSSGSSTFKGGISMSNTLDPIVVFGGLNFSHGFTVNDLDQKYYGTLKKVEPGQSISFNTGLGYALSYKLTVNISFSASYGFGRKNIYTYGEAPIAESSSASFSFGTGWRLSPKRSINVGFSKGLSRDSADYSFSFSMPFNL